MAKDDDDLQTKIDAAVEKATKGLKDKNAELLEEIKAERLARKELADKAAEAEAAQKAAEEAAALKSGDVDKITKTLEAKHAKDVQKLTETLATTQGRLNQVLVDGGLTEALTKAKVAPQYLDAVKALIKTGHKAEITEKDGKTVATLDGKPIEEFVTSWSQGEQGKHYVAAPGNGGGGAGGPGGGGGAPTVKKKSEMNHVEKAAAIKEHGVDGYAKLP